MHHPMMRFALFILVLGLPVHARGGRGPHFLSSPALCVAVSPDGKTLVTGHRDRTGRLWSAASGHLLRILPGHRLEVTGVVFSPDSRLVLTRTSSDAFIAPQEIRVWEVSTGNLRFTIRGRDDLPVEFAWSPGSDVLAVIDSLGGRLYSRSDGKVFGVLNAARGQPMFSPNGEALATAGEEATVLVWDALTARLKTEFRGHAAFPARLRFSPSGQILASEGHLGLPPGRRYEVKLWNLKTGGLAATLSDVVPTAYSPDGKLLATRNSAAELWDPTTGRRAHRFPGHGGITSALVLSRDGESVATGGDDGIVRVWSLPGGALRYELSGPESRVRSLAFSPDGTFLIAAGGATALVWNMTSGQLQSRLVRRAGREQPIQGMWLSPEGTTVILHQRDDEGRTASVTIWDPRTGRLRATIETPLTLR